ncbi:MAG: Hpt domain-containing protein [Leptospiraceae bacterium]|nr:Hpt domain-containing protein [Leptospiraceae bacterium]
MKIKIDPDILELIPEYLKEVNSIPDNLKQLISENNFIEVKNLGHKMKGHGSAYGFDFISQIGQKLEEKALKKNKPELLLLTEELSSLLAEVEIE